MLQPALLDIEQASFKRDGFIIVRRLADKDLCQSLEKIAREHLAALIAPVEYEIDVNYPGSPVDADADGANTARRLLQVYGRDVLFRQWATDKGVHAVLRQLFNHSRSPRPRSNGDSGETQNTDTPAHIALSQCHHNCVMTKTPGFSSVTPWHQDNRYWSFDRQDLISVWLALGNENRTNGCLRVIPGSHRMDLEPGRFDAALFLRPDLPENKALIARAELVELGEGDTLFFHSRLFHAAGRNLSNDYKLSLVYSYHTSDNHPIRNTRSARFPSIRL